MRRLRGAMPVQNAREDAYARGLSQSGDHICVPWLGIDIEGNYVCPGFEYKPNRGLLAYVIPLVLYREAGLQPGFAGTPKFTLPPRDSRDPSRVQQPTEVQQVSRLSPEVLTSEYFRLLRQYMRVVKIAGTETERKFIPNPEEYYVVVHGPYERSLIGHLVTRPDGSGSRFFVPDGVDPKTVEQKKIASRLNAPSSKSGAPPLAGAAGASPSPSTAGAALKAAVVDLRAAGKVYGRMGIPKTGRSYDREIQAEDITVVASGRPPAKSSSETLRGIQAQDPARMLRGFNS